jgi:LmbE family N-acetylglucosaminyl deacetylase
MVAAQSLDGTGTVATGLLLRRLDGVKRVLMIGAHPDDEDTGLLTALARGMGAETAYLSLTRGDGGQNLIGPELFEGLGVIRTGELEAARALDGAAQRFTRAFDFGFSKSADEALTLWPHDELLADVVWTIRTFRPQVVVSVFSGTPADGHGQHQAAGIMAREAFAAAADPTRFQEQLTEGVTPWAPAKLFQTSRRRFAPGTPVAEGEVVVPIGALDPLLGRSGFQLAMESRSQHRSQDMGAAQTPGPQSSSVVLVESRVPDAVSGIFAGIDTTIVSVSGLLDGEQAQRAADELTAYRAAIARARASFGPDPEPVVDGLSDALLALDRAGSIVERSAGSVGALEVGRLLEERRALVTRALMAASGVVFDVRARDDVIVRGQSVGVEAIVWNGGSAPLRAAEVALELPPDWSARLVEVEGVGDHGTVEGRTLATWRFQVTVPESAALSHLYYLREPRNGAMYRWPDAPDLRGLPRDPAAVRGRIEFTVGQPVPMRDVRAWRYVGVDQAFGEYVEPVLVLPRVSVRTSTEGMVWPEGSMASRLVTVVVGTQEDTGSRGTVSVEAPEGWDVEPAQAAYDLPGAGSERSLSFRVTPSDPPETGAHTLRVTAVDVSGRRYVEGFTVIDYPHIERAALFGPARTEVTVVPVRVRDGLRVGYIMGTGDDGPEAIRQMGAQVELLDDVRVRDGDFDSFDVLVLGVRAYEARPDVRAANQQILDFARSGGVVINQYNQYQFSDGGYAPYRLVIGQPAPRVSIETRPVRMLRPDAPLFSAPNRITEADFEGWVQERGLYFASEWDDAFVPMLEMNDPGEPPRQGSLLVAPVGEGVYVYAALSFFRQWSQRVPGAYRIFANLISLDPGAWAAFRGF